MPSPCPSCWYWLLLIWKATPYFEIKSQLCQAPYLINVCSVWRRATFPENHPKKHQISPKEATFSLKPFIKHTNLSPKKTPHTQGIIKTHTFDWPDYPVGCHRRRPPTPSTSTCRQGRRWRWSPADTAESGLLSSSCLARLMPRWEPDLVCQCAAPWEISLEGGGTN